MCMILEGLPVYDNGILACVLQWDGCLFMTKEGLHMCSREMIITTATLYTL